MGKSYWARCTECGTENEVFIGGGFTFHLFRCDRCGEQRNVNFDKLCDLHDKHLRGCAGSWSVDMPEAAETSDRFDPGRALRDSEYCQRLEELLAPCRCGGTFRMNAAPRCSKCRSTKLIKTGEGLLYD